MIANCEHCGRKQVPAFACPNRGMTCYICHGDIADPYCELVTDWEDVEQRINVVPWCDACQSNHWPDQCDPDLDQQRMPR